jgi:hypothetical protein
LFCFYLKLFPFISFKSQEGGLRRLFISITSDRYYHALTDGENL